MRDAKNLRRDFLFLIAAAATATISYATTHGVGLAHDSLEYVGAARSFLAGRGLYVLGEQGGLGPLTHFPPLTSLLLALAGKLAGRDPLQAARLVFAPLFGINVLLIGLMVRRCTRSPWLPPIVSLLVAVNPVMIALHATPCSEPLFFALGFAALLLMSSYVSRRRILLLLAAAAAIALSLITRYPGIAFLGAAVFGLLRYGGGSLPSRLGRCAMIGLIAGVPLGVWVMRNQRVEHRAAGREVAFHPLKAEKLKIGKETVEAWIAPAVPPHVPRKVAVALVALGMLGMFFRTMRRRSEARSSKLESRRNFEFRTSNLIRASSFELRALESSTLSPEYRREGAGIAPHAIRGDAPRVPISTAALRSMLGVYALLHIAVLLVTMLFFDASIALDPRMLAPIYLVALVLLAIAVDAAIVQGRALQLGCAVLALLVLGSYLGASVPMVLQTHREPAEYASSKWQKSPLLMAVRALPPDVPVYSNGPEGLWFITGRAALKLPGTLERMSDHPNAAYPQEIAEMRRRLREENGAVAYFDNRHIIRYDLPTAEQLAHDLGDVRVQQFPDGEWITIRGRN